MFVVKCGISSRRPRPRKAKTANLAGTHDMTYWKPLLLALAIAGPAIALSASPGLAFSSEAQQMCSGDAMRLCSNEIPDIPRITACMHRKRAQVSSGCRALMDREVASARKARRAAAGE